MSDRFSVCAAPPRPAALLKLLAHDLRWKIIAALIHTDLRGQDLSGIVRQPQNLISYHLKRLRDMRLVTERRSSADGRDVYYKY